MYGPGVGEGYRPGIWPLLLPRCIKHRHLGNRYWYTGHFCAKCQVVVLKRRVLICGLFFLAGAALALGTTNGVNASGGNRVRLFLVPPALPEVASQPSSTSVVPKTVAKKNEKIEAAIALYKAGLIAKAVPLFQQVLLAQPTNAPAHYYYANCLAQQGQNSAARFEYQSSLHYSHNLDLSNYCKQALQNLDALSSSKAISEVVPGASSKTNIVANVQTKGAHFDQQLERLREEVNREYHHKLDEKKAELNRKISKIKQEADEEINATPKYFPAHIRTQNINYDTTIAAIQAKAETKIKILTSDYQDEFRLIDETYGRRLDALASSHQNLKGQMGATVGSSQVTPAGTSFYVRNYVNFGGVAENSKTGSGGSAAATFSPGLRAVPGRLKPFVVR